MNGNHSETTAIEADIERTREDLADTVDQLTARLDFKSRLRESVTGPNGKPKPAVLAAVGGVAAVLAAALVLRARRGR